MANGKLEWTDEEMLEAMFLRDCGYTFEQIAEHLTLRRGEDGVPLTRNAVAGTIGRVIRDLRISEGE